jgi:polysaccharide export outer membrane protein
MEFGGMTWFHRGCSFSLAFASVLAIVSTGWAQQRPSEPPSAAQSSVPGPAAQAASQAVVGSGTANTPGENRVSENPGNTQTPASVGAPDSTLRLGAGDLIEVSVYNVPELTTKARIGNSGDVYLPLIDYVHVGDLSVEEAQTVIAKRLADGGYVRNPHVTIFVDESASQGVTMLGEVVKQGIYPDLGDHKLYQMISEAGGFTAAAARKVSIVRRNQAQPINITLPRNLADDMSGNVEIFPGDTIMVPRAPIIYVVGDVGRPSGLLIDNGTLTVLQAIALAGGANRTAKTSKVRIIHKGPTGMTETLVPLNKMLRARAPDVQLQPDDILFVPVSGARAAAGRTIEAAMSMATAVSIYAVHP